MAVDRTIFDEPHHQSLELLAAQALADGDVASAFRLADRRCRIRPVLEAHCFVLRSEASYRLGAKGAAVDDLEKALRVAPDDIAANRRMLVWGDRLQRSQAATSLIAHERNFDGLRRAIRILFEDRQRNFANITVLDDAIEGWAVWRNDVSLQVSIIDGVNDAKTTIEADPFHPLGDCGYAASFRVQRPQAAKSQSILLAAGTNVFYSARAPANAWKSKCRVHWPRDRNARDQQVTVIVPIYGDYDATHVCLNGLLNELHSSGHRAILVNDATPDTRIEKYLLRLQREHCIEVLVNALNLGFVGTTNRALEHTNHGDVILLNADTIVPLGFISRLVAAAYSSPDIGTVMPLSNHGFPIPDGISPVGTPKEVERIDAIASNINAHKIIDIPTAIGFCLYITRACLDAVGLLTEDFGRGYYEDADFCMRARNCGFRNVCAPSIYVGHSGSKSFGQQKRSLVVRNLRIIDRRYPKYRAEWAAFTAADPLRTAREAIERRAVGIPSHPRLFVTGVGAISVVARERARSVASETEHTLILEAQHQSEGETVKITNPAGGMPQSVQCNLSDAREYEMLVDFVRSMQPSAIEILDPANVPLQLVDLLLGLDVPYDIFIADAGLLGQHNKQAFAVQFLGKQRASERENRIWRGRWDELTKGARRIRVPCAQAEAFVASHLPRPIIDKVQRCSNRDTGKVRRRRRKGAVCHLGFVPMRCCAQEQYLMSQLALRLNAARPGTPITVLGPTLDDIDLMRTSSVFVTGTVDADEFGRLVDSLGVQQLFVSNTAPLFGHPIQTAIHSSGLPTALFDWSKGHLKLNKKDLFIDPHSSLDDVFAALNRWLPAP